MGRAAAALALAALLVGCGDDEVEATVRVLPVVAAGRVLALDFEEEIRASGDLRSPSHTTVSAELAGRVTEIRVDEGNEVVNHQIVLELDPERRRLELDAARARFEQATAQLAMEQSEAQRERTLSESKISSESRLVAAEPKLRLAESSVAAVRAEVGVAKRALADASVAAPFDGWVAERHVQLGEFVQPGAELFELVTLDPLEAIFHVPEIDSSRVRVGQRVVITVAALPGRTFEGMLSFVSPIVDPATRSLRIKAEISNEEGVLRPGLFARSTLGVNRREGILMVPEESLIQRASGAVLFALDDDNRVSRVGVETGVTRDGLVEVIGPVAAGQRIVVRGHGGLVEGAAVEVPGEASAGAGSGT